jgi:hypothetical protein
MFYVRAKCVQIPALRAGGDMRLTAITFLIGFVLVLAAALQTELNHRAKVRQQGTVAPLQTAVLN